MHRPHWRLRLTVLLAGPVLIGGPVCLGEQAADAKPACLLGWPGVSESFVLFSDGSVQVGRAGMTVSESIDPGRERSTGGRSEATPTLSWMAPGTRVVRASRDVDGLEFVSLTAADLYGRPAPSLWLFRTLTITNSGREARASRLTIRVSCGDGQHDPALRRGSILTDGGRVLLVSSRKASGLEVDADSGGARLTFDLEAPRETPAELLIAVPSAPGVYEEADAPDVSNLQPSGVIEGIASHWRQVVVPDTLTVGSALVTEAFHAAVSGLILCPPGEEASATEAAAWMSGLARARQGAVASEFVESLVGKQNRSEGLTTPADVVGQADLTTALADYARHADDPGRMCRLLWGTVSGAAGDLSTRAAGTANAGTRLRACLALQEAAGVADMVGQEAQAAAWRREAMSQRPERDANRAAGDVADLFGSRAYAAALDAEITGPTALSAEAESGLTECLARAHVALLAGTQEDRLLAWQRVEDRLQAQPLPGAFIQDGSEDTLAAAQLIALVCDGICQSGAGELRLFPALPVEWARDGLLVQLTRFPSGVGPLDLEASSRKARATVEPLELPKNVTNVALHALLGVETLEVGLDGRRLTEAAFRGGPPWRLDPKAHKIVMRFARPAGD